MVDPTSVILACVAIALSVSFFWMSLRMSERVSEATRRIELSVEKLEIVFKTQHEETFSMAKTAFDDFRRRAFTEKATEEDLSKLADEKTNERIENIRKEISREMDVKISELGKKAKKTDAEISEIKASMDELLGKAITKSREAEKDTALETLRNEILVKLLYFYRRAIKILDLSDLSKLVKNPPYGNLLNALLSLEKENWIEMSGMPTLFKKDHIYIRLTEKGIKRAEEIKHEMES